MKITSVTLDGVGKFGTRTEIAGLGAGVNILAAGNEAGKSTMFRAVRACLFERLAYDLDTAPCLSCRVAFPNRLAIWPYRCSSSHSNNPP